MRHNKLYGKAVSIMLIGAMVVGSMIPMQRTSAVNPIVQDVYTADPAPMVCSDGRVYVYTSHDEDETINGFFTMNDWKCYSTTDMVNWTDHGTVLSYHEFEWAKENSSWAGQVVERDGKFYYYVPINAKSNGQTSIGVAVSDSPTGPFEDPLGKPLIGPAPNYIDPTVWIDDDGQAYLYWGNPDLKCVVLNDDMISYDTSYGDNGIITWEMETNDYKELSSMTDADKYISSGEYANDVSDALKDMQAQFGVGTRTDKNKVRRPTMYEEGPWFYKRGEHYYMIYAANGIPERIDYSMSDSPLGPWEYKGMIMDDNVDGKGTGSFTNHPGVIDYKGHSYLFYHTGKLPDGGGYHRSVAVEEIYYNEDGTIEPVDFTDDGVYPVEDLDPYQRVEAETLAWGQGIEKEPCSQGGINLCNIDDGDYVKVESVGFGDYGAVKFKACTSSDKANEEKAGTIEIYLDSLDGDLIGTVDIMGSGAIDAWTSADIDIDNVTGTHDVYFAFKGTEESSEDLFRFDYWQFVQKEIPATPTPVPSEKPTEVPNNSNNNIQTALPQVSPTAAPVSAPAKAKKPTVKAGKKSMKIKLKKVSGADGYRVMYSTNKAFRKAVKKVTTKKVALTVKKLKKGKTYYVKAAAYKMDASGKKLYGKYSAAVKVKIK